MSPVGSAAPVAASASSVIGAGQPAGGGSGVAVAQPGQPGADPAAASVQGGGPYYAATDPTASGMAGVNPKGDPSIIGQGVPGFDPVAAGVATGPTGAAVTGASTALTPSGLPQNVMDAMVGAAVNLVLTDPQRAIAALSQADVQVLASAASSSDPHAASAAAGSTPTATSATPATYSTSSPAASYGSSTSGSNGQLDAMTGAATSASNIDPAALAASTAPSTATRGLGAVSPYVGPAANLAASALGGGPTSGASSSQQPTGQDFLAALQQVDPSTLTVAQAQQIVQVFNTLSAADQQSIAPQLESFLSQSPAVQQAAAAAQGGSTAPASTGGAPAATGGTGGSQQAAPANVLKDVG